MTQSMTDPNHHDDVTSKQPPLFAIEATTSHASTLDVIATPHLRPAAESTIPALADTLPHCPAAITTLQL